MNDLTDTIPSINTDISKPGDKKFAWGVAEIGEVIIADAGFERAERLSGDALSLRQRRVSRQPDRLGPEPSEGRVAQITA